MNEKEITEGNKISKRYTVAFVFTSDLRNVWLIEKQKPEWQKGLLNGIGGKMEEGETPAECCSRELYEEAGIESVSLGYVGVMGGENNDSTSFECHIFAAVTDEWISAQESERILLYDIQEVRMYKTVGNVIMLIEACLYKLSRSSNFKELKMMY